MCVCVCVCVYVCMELPWWLRWKESVCNARDPDSIPASGRSPGEGNGNLLQYSYLENLTNRGAWQATVHGIAKSRTCLSVWAQAQAHI